MIKLLVERYVLVVFHTQRITLCWVPGHKDIRGIEETDFIAKTPHHHLQSLRTLPPITHLQTEITPPLSEEKRKLKILENIAIKKTVSSSRATNNLKPLIYILTNRKILLKSFRGLNTSSLTFYQDIHIYIPSSENKTITSTSSAPTVL